MSYKTKLVALAILVTSLACSNSEIAQEKQSGYQIGNIYIGNQEYLDNLNDIQSNDILILDDRDNETDPDIKVYDSYRIIDYKSMDIVINEILSYEEKNPSNWERTHSSMKHEWLVHNLAYYLNYKKERSKDVDFNNNDEIKYSRNIVKSK